MILNENNKIIEKKFSNKLKIFLAVLKRFQAKRKNGFEKIEKVIFLLKNGQK